MTLQIHRSGVPLPILATTVILSLFSTFSRAEATRQQIASGVGIRLSRRLATAEHISNHHQRNVKGKGKGRNVGVGYITEDSEDYGYWYEDDDIPGGRTDATPVPVPVFPPATAEGGGFPVASPGPSPTVVPPTSMPSGIPSITPSGSPERQSSSPSVPMDTSGRVPPTVFRPPSVPTTDGSIDGNNRPTQPGLSLTASPVGTENDIEPPAPGNGSESTPVTTPTSPPTVEGEIDVVPPTPAPPSDANGSGSEPIPSIPSMPPMPVEGDEGDVLPTPSPPTGANIGSETTPSTPTTLQVPLPPPPSEEAEIDVVPPTSAPPIGANESGAEPNTPTIPNTPSLPVEGEADVDQPALSPSMGGSGSESGAGSTPSTPNTAPPPLPVEGEVGADPPALSPSMGGNGPGSDSGPTSSVPNTTPTPLPVEGEVGADPPALSPTMGGNGSGSNPSTPSVPTIANETIDSDANGNATLAFPPTGDNTTIGVGGNSTLAPSLDDVAPTISPVTSTNTIPPTIVNNDAPVFGSSFTADFCRGSSANKSMPVSWRYAVEYATNISSSEMEDALLELELKLASRVLNCPLAEAATVVGRGGRVRSRRQLQTDTTVNGMVGVDYKPDDTVNPDLMCFSNSSDVGECVVYSGTMMVFLEEDANDQTATREMLRVIRDVMQEGDFPQIASIISVTYLEPVLVDDTVVPEANADAGSANTISGPSQTVLVAFTTMGIFVFIAISLVVYRYRGRSREGDGTLTLAAGSGMTNEESQLSGNGDLRPVSPFSAMLPTSYKMHDQDTMSAILEGDSDAESQALSSIIMSDGGYTTDGDSLHDGTYNASHMDPVLGAHKVDDDNMENDRAFLFETDLLVEEEADA